jgi:hypothetical protein
MVDFVINDVNGNNTIVNNGPIVINGDFPDTSGVAVAIGQHPLQVDSASATSITCSPVDVFTSPLPFGSHSLKVTGAGSATKTIFLEIDDTYQVVTLDRVVPPLLAEGLVGVVEGDQLACPKVVGASTLTLTDRGDVTYSPPVPDGTTHNRYWCDVSYGAWASGPVTINGGTPTGPVGWKGTPAPPTAKSGTQYTYSIGLSVNGDRPITLADAGTALPPGLSYDDAAYPETISGVPTTPGVYTGIITRADNGTSADSEPYTITVGEDIPDAPVISLFVAITNTLGEVTLTGRTNTVSGTVYAVVDANSERPTAEQVRDGQNAAGAPARGKGSAAVSTADLSVTITGLPSDTLLYGWLAQWV